MWKYLIGVIVVALAIYWQLQTGNQIKNSPSELRDRYDYIIVGGGTAGCILAARLSENQNINVLLLEAGPSPENYSRLEIPAFAVEGQLSEIDWQFKTVPQNDACLGLEDQVVNWPSGKVLGGSSFINFMTYVRGNRKDFDIWEALGNTGWDYKSVLPYFNKHEKAASKGLRMSEYRGKDGPITINRAKKTIFGENFLRAIKNSGVYQKLKDYNGAEQEGFSRMQRNVGGGLRQNSAGEYLIPVISRRNLDVLVNAYVTKILFDDSKKAIGVKYHHASDDGTEYKVFADKEIILSAGATKSPQILMLSGIGPSSELEDFQIPVIADLPVGQNMQSHIAVDLNFKLNSSVGLDPADLNSFSSWLNWKMFGNGIWEQFGPELVGFLKSPFATENNDVPDVQYIIFPFAFGPLLAKPMNLTKEVTAAYHPSLKTEQGMSVLCINNHPLSRGTIELQSSNPFDHPIIDANFLEYEQDADVLVYGLLKFFDLIKLPQIAHFGPTFAETALPECSSWTLGSNEYLKCLVKHRTFNMYHPTSTCPMGPDGDDTAVVDHELRVKGVSNLRVIDGSVFPSQHHISGNMQASVFMIAEKMADSIKNQIENKNS